MGFLIFAFRELQLKREISRLQLKDMMLSMKLQEAVSQAGNLEEMLDAGKNALNTFTSNSLAAVRQSIMGQYSGGNAGANPNLMMMQMQNQQQEIIAKNAAMCSVFDSAYKCKIKQASDVETHIKKQMTITETQITAKTGELENVSKAREKESKDAAPTFGLGRG